MHDCDACDKMYLLMLIKVFVLTSSRDAMRNISVLETVSAMADGSTNRKISFNESYAH